MEKLGKELEFISRINADGSGTVPRDESSMKFLNKEKFKLTALSLGERTYIASGMNSYVVRLKASRMKFRKEGTYALSDINKMIPEDMEMEEYGWDLPGRQFLLLASHEEVYSFVSIKKVADVCYRCVHAEILTN